MIGRDGSKVTIRSRRTALFAAMLCLLAFTSAHLLCAQSLDLNKQRGRIMLDVIRKDIEKNYYDPQFRGIDLQATFGAAQEKIKQAQSLGQIFGIIAQALTTLEDSHTFFVPPDRTEHVDYGWQMGMVGEHCYVTAVKPGSDAAAKGLRVGDEVLSIDGRPPTRQHLWKITYLYYTLRPQAGMNVTVKRADGARDIVVAAKVRQGKRLLDFTGEDRWAAIRESESEARLQRHRYYDDVGGAFVWKMPQFDLDNQDVDRMMARAEARQSLILDLRGNAGGYETTLQRMIGNLFDHDVTIADIHGRKESKPLVAKTRGAKAYKGRVVVLIDHRSASSAEMFARVMQLEKRGTVIGDRSAGAVMRARFFDYQFGVDVVFFYGASITDADVVMSDGKSLERVGVTPDEVVLPSAEDLAAQRDPALSRAAALVGVQLTSERAGALFPVEWRK
jgi:carboxyl-terminal processing protease